MKQSPTVSVVIPCYNHGVYLAEALSSVEAQSYRDFEIIVVDDGSSDPQSLAALAALEPRFTKVIHTTNQGVVSARNTGISAAQGRYILPLDADDKIGARYLELAVAQLEKNPDLGIVYCKAEFFGEQSGPWQLPPYRFPDILIGNVIFNAGVFKRTDWEAVGGYNANMRDGWEDFDFWIALIAQGCDVYQLPETLFYYRIQQNSRNASMQEHSRRYAQAYTQIYRNHHALYEKHIDVVFNEMTRLWDLLAEKQQQLAETTHSITTLNHQHSELSAQHQHLRAENALLLTELSTLRQALSARENSLLSKCRRYFGL